MKIEKYFAKNVTKNGKLEDGGFVITKGAITINREEDRPNGYWIAITAPRSLDGTVEGLIVKFTGEKEMDVFFEKQKMTVK